MWRCLVARAFPSQTAANLRSSTKILDFRGFDSSRILVLRGGILMSIGDFPAKSESTNLSKDDLSREIWRDVCHAGFDAQYK